VRKCKIAGDWFVNLKSAEGRWKTTRNTPFFVLKLLLTADTHTHAAHRRTLTHTQSHAERRAARQRKKKTIKLKICEVKITRTKVFPAPKFINRECVFINNIFPDLFTPPSGPPLLWKWDCQLALISRLFFVNGQFFVDAAARNFSDFPSIVFYTRFRVLNLVTQAEGRRHVLDKLMCQKGMQKKRRAERK